MKETDSRAYNGTKMVPRGNASSSWEILASSTPQFPHAPSLSVLPMEYINNILQRLPVTEISKLRGVCTSWNSLISSPRFANAHFEHAPKVTRLVIFSFNELTKEYLLRRYPLHDMFNAVHVTAETIFLGRGGNKNKMIASCNGILCFLNRQRPGLVVLWNPNIGKINNLPLLDIQYRKNCYIVYGFGFDNFSHTYKVVAVFCYLCDDGNLKAEVHVFTLGTDSWRRVEEEFAPQVPWRFEYGKFVSGSLHWITDNASESLDIISFNLRTESCEVILQPDYGLDKKELIACTLHVFRDCLSVLSRTEMFFDVWVMGEYGNIESWSKLIRVRYKFDNGPNLYSTVHWISEDEQLLLENKLYQNQKSEFVVYNTRNRKLSVPLIQIKGTYIAADIYVDSLISP